MGLKILITGGLGYIGAHVCAVLHQKGYRIVLMDNLSNSFLQMYHQLITLLGGQSLEFEKKDISRPDEVKELFRKHSDIKGVIHLAALKSVNQSIAQPLSYYHNNVGGLITLLSEVKSKNIPFLFSSSCTVYGQADQLPIKENTSLKPSFSPYGFTKQVGEQIIKDTAKANDSFKAMSLRYFNPIGAHPSSLIGEWPIGEPQNLVPYITQVGIGKRKELKIFGDTYDTTDGTCIRDYIHVMDLAEAHVLGLETLFSSNSNHYVYNVGLGKGVSVKEMVSRFEKVSERPIKYKISKARKGDVPIAYADASRIRHQLNWQPKYSINDALLSAWNWEKYLHSNNDHKE